MKNAPAYVIQNWVAALRSGTYAQGFGTFETNGGCLCALGLLCKSNGEITRDPTGSNWIFVEKVLGRKFVQWVVKWNDCDSLSFPQIADKVETLFEKECGRPLWHTQESRNMVNETNCIHRSERVGCVLPACHCVGDQS